jgi:uncharacterized protein (DUF2236 family)
MLAGWGRAILLQLAHPLVAQGVADHSGFARDPRGRVRRLERTLRAMLALTFGTAEEAAEAAAGINKIHDRVNGQLRESAGTFAAGTGYSAHDPALLAWVHATLVDTFLLTFERFVAPLSPVERDRYCREAGGVAPLLGIPADGLPRSTDELAAYMKRMLSSGEIVVTGPARTLASEVLSPGLPWPARPLLAFARLATVGLLPPPIREAYGFEWSPRKEWALLLLSAAARQSLPFLPPLVRHWPAARRAARRLSSHPNPGGPMRTPLLAVIVGLGLLSTPASAQVDQLLKGMGIGQQSGLSEGKASAGLKEALKVATEKSVSLTGRPNGYFSNAAIKIPMPENLRSVEQGLRLVGYGPQVDEFVLSMNRAAEQAAPAAKQIFVDAITGMTFDDAKKILTGGDTSATEFFKAKTTDKLTAAFRPVVDKTMREVGVVRQYQALIGRIEAIPFAKSQAFDIDGYVTNKALGGLFHVVGEQERQIRTNPAARTTALLQEVFAKK